jgi:aminomethyltransferase
VEEAYGSARDSALVVRHAGLDSLRISGRHRLDLLHRLSTNDVAALRPGEIRRTVLTSPIARIIDAPLLLVTGQDICLLVAAGQGELVRSWLARHIFFQDEVTLSSVTRLVHFGCYGPQSQAFVRARLGVEAPGVPETCLESAAGFVWSIRRPAPGGHEWALSEGPGEEVPDEPGSPARLAYEALRIEDGLPLFGAEITPDRLPTEVGLEGLVSLRKGCYTGQEILARMESRGRKAWQLAGIRLPHELPVPQAVHQNEHLAGTITSAAWSPQHGWIGLAVVRPDALETDGGRVALQADEAQLVELPFSP